MALFEKTVFVHITKWNWGHTGLQKILNPMFNVLTRRPSEGRDAEKERHTVVEEGIGVTDLHES